MKKTEIRRKAKEVLNYMFCNSYDWMDNESLVEGLSEDDIAEVDNMLDYYIAAIAKRYNI